MTADAHLSGIFAGLYGQLRVVPARFHEAAGASWLDGYDFGAGKPTQPPQRSAAVSHRLEGRKGLTDRDLGNSGMVGRRA